MNNSSGTLPSHTVVKTGGQQKKSVRPSEFQKMGGLRLRNKLGWIKNQPVFEIAAKTPISRFQWMAAVGAIALNPDWARGI